MVIDPVSKCIIDNHIVKDYNYYGSICKDYMGGRYMADDMLHRLYEEMIKVKPETIKKFNEIGKLRSIGKLILRSLYCKRDQGNKYANKKTSELHQIPSVNKYDISLAVEEYGYHTDETHRRLNTTVQNLLRNKDTWFYVQVFVQCQEISILELSKRTKISRSYLTKAYKKGHELLKTQMQ